MVELNLLYYCVSINKSTSYRYVIKFFLLLIVLFELVPKLSIYLKYNYKFHAIPCKTQPEIQHSGFFSTLNAIGKTWNYNTEDIAKMDELYWIKNYYFYLT